ncbi:MAG: type II toxin-antitoxin system HipA family toxin [Schleiferiaceae bacterium]
MVTAAAVYIWGELAGAIIWDDDRKLASFQYDEAFLEKGWDIAPLTMPISGGNRVYSFPENRAPRNATQDTFRGLPGLLADSLPDKYGNQLINAWLAKNNRAPNSMNPVEQLCFMGTRGMGALEFQPSEFKTGAYTFEVEIDSLVQMAHSLLNNREEFETNLHEDREKALTEIFKIGTSAGGARPKAIIAYNPKTGEVRSGQTRVPKGFEHWLIKLDGVSDVQLGSSHGWGRVEYAYFLMAREAGIAMAPCKLLEEGGRAHFMTQRFDRGSHGEKLHLQTFCALEHYDFNDMLSYSYEELFTTMRRLHLTYPEAEEMYRRMVFNIIATNCDDHTKNFGFLLSKDGKWTLSPAYDICFAYDPQSLWVDQHTLSLRGKRVGHNRKDLLDFADQQNIKGAEKIIEGVINAVSQWKQFASETGISKELTEHIQSNLKPQEFKNPNL